jgi:hypothetical protein
MCPQLDGLVAVSPEDGSLNIIVAIFVNSYIVIVVWILLQVSVAVLLVCCCGILLWCNGCDEVQGRPNFV